MKVLLDTNVLFAAYAAHGFCEALLATCLQSHTIILSEHILSERRTHLVGKLKMSAAEAAEIEQALQSDAEIVDPVDVPDISTLGEFDGIPIITPRALHDRIG